jgi:hypothetical protein
LKRQELSYGFNREFGPLVHPAFHSPDHRTGDPLVFHAPLSSGSPGDRSDSKSFLAAHSQVHPHDRRVGFQPYGVDYPFIYLGFDFDSIVFIFIDDQRLNIISTDIEDSSAGIALVELIWRMSSAQKGGVQG